jgi:uncharacterized protein YtpQ (UPF0354 family)
MWPFTKRKYTSKAIAYLKAAEPITVPDNSIVLSREDSPVIKELGDGLLVCYVVDTGNSFEYVQFRHLDKDGISPDELHRIGLLNLAILANGRLRVAPQGNIFAVLLDGNFEASAILVNAYWDDGFRQFVTGDYAVTIAARDILAFCDASSEQGIKELQDVVERLKSAGVDHPISDSLYIRREGRWARMPAQRHRE